jgi:heme oxygenase-like protein
VVSPTGLTSGLTVEDRSSRSTASDRLRGKVSLISPAFGAACARVFMHTRIRDLLPRYLLDVHCVIRSTVPLMEAVAARAEELAPSDPVAAGVAAYLRQHIEEERFHDEWLLEDLDLMGVDRTTVLSCVPSPTVAGVAGSQYFWGLHFHPVSLLGYFAFSEAFPPSTELIGDLIERTGYRPEAFRTFVVHGDLDTGHREDIDRTIDALPLLPEHEAMLGLSALSTGQLLTQALHEAVEDFEAAG